MQKLNRKKCDIGCSDCYVKNLCFGRSFDAEELESLDSIIDNVYIYKPEEYIFKANSYQRYIGAIHTGYAKQLRTNHRQGTKKITNFFLPGDIIGIETANKSKHAHDIVAITEVSVCMINIDKFFKLIENQHISILKPIEFYCAKIYNDGFIELSTNSTRRVLQFLVNFVTRYLERNPHHKILVMPIRQIDISDFLGLRNETLNRILHKFKDQGLLKIDNGSIFINSFDKILSYHEYEYN